MLEMSALSPARRATLATLFSGIIVQLALLVSGVVSARLLGVEGRGYLALYVLFPTILVNLLGLGLPQALTYYIARNKALVFPIARQVYPVFAAQTLAIILFQLVILGVYQGFDSGMDPFAGYVTAGVVPGLLAQQYGQSVLQGLARFRAFNLVRLLMPIGYAAAIVVLLIYGRGSLLDIVTAWVIATSVAATLTLVVVTRVIIDGNNSGGELQVPGLGLMIQFGLKGLFGSASPLEMLRIDQFIAGIMLSPAMLGLYVAAQSFTTLPRFIGQSVGIIAYPVMAANQESNRVDTVWRIFRTVLTGNAVVVAALILLMPQLLPLLFGPDFEGAVIPAQILLIGAYFMSARRVLVEGARGLGSPQLSSYAELSVYPLFIMGVFVIMPHLGLSGLAVSVTSGFGFSLLIAVLLAQRLRGSIYCQDSTRQRSVVNNDRKNRG